MFYDQYLYLCNQKGIAPSRVAQDIGVSKTSVSRWKDGATPNAEILAKLADYFNVSTDFLLGKTDIKKEPSPEDNLERAAAAFLKVFLDRGIVPDLSEKSLLIVADIIAANMDLVKKLTSKDD